MPSAHLRPKHDKIYAQWTSNISSKKHNGKGMMDVLRWNFEIETFVVR
jgi:hypothetical protein